MKRSKLLGMAIAAISSAALARPKIITSQVSSIIDVRNDFAAVLKKNQIVLVNLNSEKETTLAPTSDPAPLSRFSDDGHQFAYFLKSPDDPQAFEVRVFDLKEMKPIFRTSKITQPVGLVWSGCRIGVLSLQKQPVALLEFDVTKGCQPKHPEPSNTIALFQMSPESLVAVDQTLTPVAISPTKSKRGLLIDFQNSGSKWLLYGYTKGGFEIIQQSDRSVVIDRSTGSRATLSPSGSAVVFEDPPGVLKLWNFTRKAAKELTLASGSHPFFANATTVIFLKGRALCSVGIKNK